eukprot:scaffold225987_cov73-Cyclotella_meneghiniana.AAC.1
MRHWKDWDSVNCLNQYKHTPPWFEMWGPSDEAEFVTTGDSKIKSLCPEFSARTPLEAENLPPSGVLAERMDYLSSSRSA